MMRLLRGLFRNERGVTLVELLVVVAITGVIVPAFTAVLVQITRIGNSNSSQVQALRSLDTAGDWFIRDFQPAQTLPGSVILSPGSNNMTIVQSTNATNDVNIMYAISSNGDLRRTIGSSNSVIAQHIISIDYLAGSSSTPSTANITANVSSKIVWKSYNIASRITTSNSLLSVASTSLPSWDEGIAYLTTLNANGGTVPYTWSISSGSMPIWATLDAASGSISGSNPTVGVSNFTVQVTDGAGATATRALSITINSALNNIAPASLPNGNIGQPYGPVTLSVSGGTSSFVWSISSGSLPSGLTLDGAVISGTPAAGAVSTTFTVEVSDGAGATLAASRSITINSPLLAVTDNATGVGKYTATLNGHITGMGNATSVTVSFEYGLTISYGSPASGTPASLTAPGSFLANISGLTHKTTYHYRAKAVGNDGTTVYGNDLTFTTKN